MIKLKKGIAIVMAEDDQDDRLLTREALAGVPLIKSLDFVEDGEELMDYLLKRGLYSHLKGNPNPGLIILDLNMPRKDGREVLKEIKGHPVLRKIPVVVLTTSRDQEDVYVTYDLGGSSYISKPVSFEDLTKVMEAMVRYWAEIVELPAERNGENN